MEWSKEAPSFPGTYWIRREEEIIPMKVEDTTLGLMCHGVKIKFVEGEWGPRIPTPEELEAMEHAVYLLSIAKCPACDGSGAILHERLVHSGEDDGMGWPISETVVDYEQCQWCAEREAIVKAKE